MACIPNILDSDTYFFASLDCLSTSVLSYCFASSTVILQWLRHYRAPSSRAPLLAPQSLTAAFQSSTTPTSNDSIDLLILIVQFIIATSLRQHASYFYQYFTILHFNWLLIYSGRLQIFFRHLRLSAVRSRTAPKRYPRHLSDV